MHTDVVTDVLIVGSGPAGASAALALSTYGVRNMVVTRYASLADTPRAHITNQRTMEVLRDLGVEQEALAKATPQHLMGNTTFCTSLAGEELGRVRSWGNEPLVQAAHELASTSWSRSWWTPPSHAAPSCATAPSTSRLRRTRTG